MYTPGEIAAITQTAHAAGALVHVDGARIANAIAATNTSVKTMLTDTDVDLVSFGAIKNGTLFGEAVVWLKPKLAQDVKRKQISVGQLSSKNRFIAAQHLAYFEDDRWLKGARQANAVAKLLEEELQGINGLTTLPVEANMIWANVSGSLHATLHGGGYVFADQARWVTAWDTTEDDVRALAKQIRGLAQH